MIVVWSGWGIVVPVFVVVAFFAMIGATSAIPGLDRTVATEICYALTGVLSAIGVFFLARYLESKPGRAFTDNATGQSFEVKPSAGSFFFIPTRYWPYILVIGGIALAAAAVLSPGSVDSLKV
jgi:hypothetical protein